jgi:UDP-N-acetyl-D-mannosaminuronate dehydrogenase
MFQASRVVGAALKGGDIVVYESTVYPGAVEEECVPLLEQVSGLKSGSDFNVGYSPKGAVFSAGQCRSPDQPLCRVKKRPTS